MWLEIIIVSVLVCLFVFSIYKLGYCHGQLKGMNFVRKLSDPLINDLLKNNKDILKLLEESYRSRLK